MKRRPRPDLCREAPCATVTESVTGYCLEHRPRKRPFTDCLHCHTRTWAKSGICATCTNDGGTVLAPIDNDELKGGHWLNVRGVMRYVPDGCGYDWVAERDAASKRVRALLAERLEQSWWERPPVADDPQVIARRLAAAVAEYAEHDERTMQREAS